MNSGNKVDLKINIIGPMGTGKTSLLNQYVHKWFLNDYQNTLGAHLLSKTIQLDNTNLNLQKQNHEFLVDLRYEDPNYRKIYFPEYSRTRALWITDPTPENIWDTGGQERFRTLVSTFYKGSDGCLLVFDVTDEESFSCLEFWRKDFLDKIPVPAADFPMIVLGNKIDLDDRQVSKESAITWCKGKNVSYLEVSAKNNVNVELAFEMLAKKALIHYQESKESCLGESIKLYPTEDSHSNTCC